MNLLPPLIVFSGSCDNYPNTGGNVGNLANIFVGKQVFSPLANAYAGVGDGASVGLARWRDGSVAGSTAVITNNDALAGLLVLGYKVRRGLYLEAGYGYTQTELDESGADEDNHQTWYVQSTIFFSENVFVTPEIGGFDAGPENLKPFTLERNGRLISKLR